mgnify:FL=1|jgi:hypothetical protein
MNSTDEQEEKWADEIKYYAARYIYFKQNKPVPYQRTNKTWREWWEAKYKTSYQDYIEEMAAKKR